MGASERLDPEAVAYIVCCSALTDKELDAYAQQRVVEQLERRFGRGRDAIIQDLTQANDRMCQVIEDVLRQGEFPRRAYEEIKKLSPREKLEQFHAMAITDPPPQINT